MRVWELEKLIKDEKANKNSEVILRDQSDGDCVPAHAWVDDKGILVIEEAEE